MIGPASGLFILLYNNNKKVIIDEIIKNFILFLFNLNFSLIKKINKIIK